MAKISKLVQMITIAQLLLSLTDETIAAISALIRKDKNVKKGVDSDLKKLGFSAVEEGLSGKSVALFDKDLQKRAEAKLQSLL